MSPKDDEGQDEWEPWTAEHLTDEQRAKILTVPWWAIRDGYSRFALVWAEVDKDAILADHRDAQQLRERVRVLEEALRWYADEDNYEEQWNKARQHHGHPVRVDRGSRARAALLSPAAATEGGEGA